MTPDGAARLPFDDKTPSVRRNDPDTSSEAARSFDAHALNRGQRIVHNAFQLARRPLTDEELIAEIRRHFPRPRLSDSSIRTRRRELQRRGLVEFSGTYGRTVAGLRSRRFEIARSPDSG